MDKRWKSVLVFTVVLFLLFVAAGCENPALPDPGGHTPPETDNTRSVVSATSVHPRYAHNSVIVAPNGAGLYEINIVGAVGDADTDSIWASMGFDTFVPESAGTAGHSVRYTIIYQADGVLYEAEGGSDSDLVAEVGFVIHAFDYVDVDGDGQFLNLDNHPHSDDYAVIAFKSVTFSDGTTDYFTWTNPDL